MKHILHSACACMHACKCVCVFVLLRSAVSCTKHLQQIGAGNSPQLAAHWAIHVLQDAAFSLLSWGWTGAHSMKKKDALADVQHTEKMKLDSQVDSQGKVDRSTEEDLGPVPLPRIQPVVQQSVCCWQDVLTPSWKRYELWVLVGVYTCLHNAYAFPSCDTWIIALPVISTCMQR